MRHPTRKRGIVITVVLLVLLAAIGAALLIRAKAPPEAARLLPESDAIVYFQLKTLRTATHFDQQPLTRSADFAHFIAATGIEPERDIDYAAFALHHMSDPRGPNGPVAYSEVFIGRFDGERLANYLASMATAKENYAGHDVYTVPVEGRALRVAQLGYDTVVASNMPTAEQIHSMLDRWRASALGTPGSSLLSRRYSDVPVLSQAWGIGHIGLPFAENGKITLLGLELPVPSDTELVASVRYEGKVQLRVKEFAPSEQDAATTVEGMNTMLNLAKGLAGATQQQDASAVAMRQILDSAKVEQDKSSAELTASASVDQLRALTTSAPSTK
ncbi:hypothetical protein ACFQBQ_05955 [Granulicella cerasi]|uniref:PpiC domain-containing protein n=1 Tax=Granulicella cerasi TaxID=741063 RepID=A0ABW1Z6Z5_9BACT|nr:hypothetical protein [Granulicella cerasi]